jgi:septum formation protein
MMVRRRLILASGSAARRQMLTSAGLNFEAIPAHLDEEALRDRLLSRTPPPGHDAIAAVLAEEKARDVAKADPSALVIGSDQILSTGDAILAKPGSRQGARATLQALRGRTHWLHSAVMLHSGGATLWSTVATATLHVRAFSDAALDAYLDAAGADIYGCVGAYQIEGAGVRLFDAIEGDHFTIMGMPLLPLLAELRRLGEIDT